jgi:hypothetical protein
MNPVFPNRPVLRRLFFACLIAFVMQMPFLVLMNIAGVHSALGGMWVFFYLPAVLIGGKIGMTMTSPFSTIVKIVVIQEILLASIILLLMALYTRIRQSSK